MARRMAEDTGSTDAPVPPCTSWDRSPVPWNKYILRRSQAVVEGSATATCSHRREIALRPAHAGPLTKLAKPVGGDGRSHTRHQFLVVGEVDRREQHCAERFVCLHKVMEVGARVLLC